MPRPLPLQQLHTLVFAAYLLGPLLFVAIQQQWRRGAIAPHCKGELVASGFDSIFYTPEEVRALTPVRNNVVESIAKQPDLRDRLSLSRVG